MGSRIVLIYLRKVITKWRGICCKNVSRANMRTQPQDNHHPVCPLKRAVIHSSLDKEGSPPLAAHQLMHQKMDAKEERDAGEDREGNERVRAAVMVDLGDQIAGRDV